MLVLDVSSEYMDIQAPQFAIAMVVSLTETLYKHTITRALHRSSIKICMRLRQYTRGSDVSNG